jgi:hypothetical protein
MSATCWILSLCLGADIPSGPGVLKLLHADDDYRKQAGAEVLLDGLIERTPTTGRPGGTERFNVFRLRYQDPSGKEEVREFFVKDEAYRLSSHLGKKVRVAGKLVETKVKDDVVHEIWPAWLQPLTGPLALAPGPDGVYARCDWQPEEARKQGARQYVFRTPEQLATAMGVSGSSAPKTASELLSRRLQLPSIDWEKQMVICVSAGLQGPAVESLAITSVKEEGEILRVKYRLSPGQGGGFGYPAQSVLVPRSAAEVRFEQEQMPRKP